MADRKSSQADAKVTSCGGQFGVLGLLWTMVAVIAGQCAWAAEAAPPARAAGPVAVLRSLDEVVASLPRFSVRGTIVDAEGQPVEGAEVFLYYAHGREGLRDRLAGQTRSDAAGAYRFEQAGVWEPQTCLKRRPDPAKYSVVARHPRHGLEFATILPGDRTENVVVRMQAPRLVKLTVVDAAGKPVEGARVSLWSARHAEAVEKELPRASRYLELEQDIGVASGVSDAQGQVELIATGGRSYFRAEKSGYARDGGDDKITLYPTERITGTVQLENGMPVAGAVVWVRYEDERQVGRQAMGVADANGQYAVDVPVYGFAPSAAGTQRQRVGSVSFKGEDLRPGTPLVGRTVVYPLNDVAELKRDVVLERGCILAGKVVDLASGQGITGFSLDCSMEIEGRQYLDTVRAKTDGEGRFVLRVPSGSRACLTLQHSADEEHPVDQEWLRQGNMIPLSQQVIDSDRTDLLIKVKMRQVAKLSGRVVDGQGQGVKGAMVYVKADQDGTPTDAHGQFSLLAPRDRNFDLHAVNGDQTLAGRTRLKAGSTTATIRLEPTRPYEGQVLNTQGLPAAGLSFYVDLEVNGVGCYRVRETLTSDAEGRFQARHLLPGAAYCIFWTSDQRTNRDYEVSQTRVDLAESKPGEPIRFGVRQYVNALMGRVVDEQGKPVAGAEIEVGASQLVPRELRGERAVRSDAHGEFALPRLAWGAVTMQIGATGYAGGTFWAMADAVDFVAVLKRPGQSRRCEVLVVDEQGNALPDAPVILWQTTYGPAGASSERAWHGKTGAAGRTGFDLPRRPDQEPVRFLVSCDLPGRDVALQQLEADGDAQVRLVASKSSRVWRGKVVDEAGRPVAGVRIAADSLQDLNQPASVTLAEGPEGAEDPLRLAVVSDEQGRFELKRLGRWRVSLCGSGKEGGFRSGFFHPEWDQGPDEKVFVLSAGGSVRGRLVIKESGQPPRLGRASITLLPLKDGDCVWGDVQADGRFVLRGVKAGTYRVLPSLLDRDLWAYVCDSPTVEVAAGTTPDVLIEMRQGIPVHGKVVQAKTGQAVREAVTINAEAKDDPYRSAWAMSKEDGSWTLYLPGDGQYVLKYRVGVNYRDMGEKTIRVQRGQAQQEVVLEVPAQPGQ